MASHKRHHHADDTELSWKSHKLLLTLARAGTLPHLWFSSSQSVKCVKVPAPHPNASRWQWWPRICLSPDSAALPRLERCFWQLLSCGMLPAAPTSLEKWEATVTLLCLLKIFTQRKLKQWQCTCLTIQMPHWLRSHRLLCRTLLEMGCGCYVLLTLSEDDAFLPCLWNQAMHLIHYDALLWAASEGSQDKVPLELPRFSIGTWWTQELNKHWFSPEAQACQHYSPSCPRRKALLQD